MPPPTLGGQRHYVFRLSRDPSVLAYKHDNSRMYKFISFKFGGRVNINRKMNWLDFGFHRSKVKVTTWQNIGKIQFWSYNSIQVYQVWAFVNGNIFLGGSVKHCWKFEVRKSMIKVTTLSNMGKTLVFEPLLHSDEQERNFCLPHD